MKSGVVTIVGRPSAGKSTLLNALAGRKVAIVGTAPQTTRNVIRGIVTEPAGQLVLLDTPGFHDSDKKLNLYLKSLVRESLPDADLVLYAVDGSRAPGEEEGQIVELLRPLARRTIAVVTKLDLKATGLQETVRFITANLGPLSLCSVSALTGEGLTELRKLLFEHAPEGEAMYPAEFYTDQPPEFRAAEIIREKATERVREELPHALFVSIEDMEERDGGAGLWIRAVIVVERESQKGILIGRVGALIREIRIASEKELRRLFPYRISLDVRVKVQPKWRQDDRLLRRLIF